MGESARSGVQAIDRAVAILRCFDSRHPELGISEIARMTGLSTSTTHRLLSSMTDNRLLQHSNGTRRYRPGPLLVQLGRSDAAATTLRDAALPFMTALRDEVDETVGLHELLPTGERVVIDQVESRQELRRHYVDLGVPVPLPHGAPGKAILSVLPWERQEWWLSRPIKPATARTITDPDSLREQLVEARERGWADSDAERTPGIRAVAAPLFEPSGSVVGAVGLSVPTVRMDDERAEALGRRAKEVAWLISDALGAEPSLVVQNLDRARQAPADPG